AAQGGLDRMDTRNLEAMLVVEVTVGLAQLPSALGYDADPPPGTVDFFEHFPQELLRRLVAFECHYALVSILDARLAGFQLVYGAADSLQNVDRFKSCDYDGHLIFFGDGRVLVVSHHAANMPGGQERS